MPVAGVDVGSVAAKAVIFDPQSRSLLGKAVLPTGWNAREAGEKALAAACADAGGIAAPVSSERDTGAFPCPLRTKWSRRSPATRAVPSTSSPERALCSTSEGRTARSSVRPRTARCRIF